MTGVQTCALPISGSLILDANGNLFGATQLGGTSNQGTLFEVARSGAGYASSPTTLVNFDSTNAQFPEAGLIADAAGNLYGTTTSGGAEGQGTVFEIVKTSTGYASTPTTLVSFSGASTRVRPCGGCGTGPADWVAVTTRHPPLAGPERPRFSPSSP